LRLLVRPMKTAIASPIAMPGTRPAANSLPTETSAIAP
jgi:hypothetical protein